MPKTITELFGVQVRPVVPSDIDALWRFEVDLELGPRSRFRGHLLSMAQYVQNIEADSIANRAIVRVRDGAVVGLAQLYAANLRCQRAWISLATSRDVRGRGLGALGMSLVISEAFATWPLRKLYIDATAGSAEQYASAIRDVFVIEGVLQRDCIVAGEPEDRLVASISREGWFDWVGAHFPRLVDGSRQPASSETPRRATDGSL